VLPSSQLSIDGECDTHVKDQPAAMMKYCKALPEYACLD
jgi:hypothetical protein